MPYNPYQPYPYKQVLARTAPIPIPAYQVPAPYNVVPPVGGVPCPGGVV